MHQNLYKITPFFVYFLFHNSYLFLKKYDLVLKMRNPKKKKLSPSSGAGRHKYLMIIRLYVSFH